MDDQHRFDDLAKGLATMRLSRWQVLKGLAASTILAGSGLVRKPAVAQAATKKATKKDKNACRVRTVTVWINAFIPRNVPGFTIPYPKDPTLTMIHGPFNAVSDCFLTDQRSFSSNIAAPSRLHSEITIDLTRREVVSQDSLSYPTHEVDCEDGDEECKAKGRVFPLDNSAFRISRVSSNGIQLNYSAGFSHPAYPREIPARGLNDDLFSSGGLARI